MTNKTEEVLKHLKTKRSITSLDAIDLYGATRLSAIIFNLKKRGHNIECRREETIDRYGNTCRYGRYFYLGTKKKENNFWIDIPFFKDVIFPWRGIKK